jgi:hypothetical protein
MPLSKATPNYKRVEIHGSVISRRTALDQITGRPR